MHQAQAYVDAQIRPSVGAPFSAIALNAAQATGLKLALEIDALSYLYSGAVSVGDAIQALERNLYSWATVKLYYAVFYFSRSLLAAQGTAILYEGTKPRSWQCRAGTISTKRPGPTHKAVLSTYVATFPTSVLLSQPIGTTQAFDWLMSLREAANYTNARFCEPEPPEHFKIVAKEGIRKLVAAYVADSSYLYAFDAQHAMLSLPLEALKLTIYELSSRTPLLHLAPNDRQYLAGLFFDKAGPLADMVTLFK